MAYRRRSCPSASFLITGASRTASYRRRWPSRPARSRRASSWGTSGGRSLRSATTCPRESHSSPATRRRQRTSRTSSRTTTRTARSRFATRASRVSRAWRCSRTTAFSSSRSAAAGSSSSSTRFLGRRVCRTPRPSRWGSAVPTDTTTTSMPTSASWATRIQRQCRNASSSSTLLFTSSSTRSSSCPSASGATLTSSCASRWVASRCRWPCGRRLRCAARPAENLRPSRPT
mmetsp:Transcript_12938/g.44161  ORF Transcript_12938/g.44161 Transcript_12938/m.44161 type:complete len:231 (-) Transcript_12938:2072-2764(-)